MQQVRQLRTKAATKARRFVRDAARMPVPVDLMPELLSVKLQLADVGDAGPGTWGCRVQERLQQS